MRSDCNTHPSGRAPKRDAVPLRIYTAAYVLPKSLRRKDQASCNETTESEKFPGDTSYGISLLSSAKLARPFRIHLYLGFDAQIRGSADHPVRMGWLPAKEDVPRPTLSSYSMHEL